MRLSYEALKKEISEHKGSFAVYMLLRAFVVLTLILQLLNGNFENVFLCLLTLLLLIVPAAIQVEFHIELPTLLEVILLVFIFCAEILGEINAFYERIPIWDTVLHDMPLFSRQSVRDYIVDAEEELKGYLDCEGLPPTTVLREQMFVAGLRLLLQAVEDREEAGDDERDADPVYGR